MTLQFQFEAMSLKIIRKRRVTCQFFESWGNLVKLKNLECQSYKLI